MRAYVIFLSALLSLFLAGCETIDSSYGYVASGLDEDSILELIALSDEAVNERQFDIYQGLFGPRFYILDKSDTYSYGTQRTGRYEYLDLVENIFKHAKELVVYTEALEIDFVEPGVRAVVMVQEETLVDYLGDRKRMVMRSEIEIGYEDGWIFFENSVTNAKQEIKE